MNRPLVIKVKTASIPPSTVGEWQDLSGMIEQFTADIITPAIDQDSDISAQVSGIPTAYARANLFKSALQSYGKSKESIDLNMNAFYKMTERVFWTLPTSMSQKELSAICSSTASLCGA